MSVQQLAKTLNCSERQVARYLARGMPRTKREAERWLAANVARRLPKSADPDLAAAVLRDVRSQAARAERELEELQPKVTSAEAAREWWALFEAVVTEEALRLTELSAEIAALDDSARIAALLHERIVEAWQRWYDRLMGTCRAHAEEEKEKKEEKAPKRRKPETLDQARARLLDARAQRRDLLVKLSVGEMVRIDRFLLALGDGQSNAVQALRGIPGKGVVLAGEEDPKKCAEILEEAVREAVALGARAFHRELKARR